MPVEPDTNGNMRPLRDVPSAFNNDLKGQHIISVDQFGVADLRFLVTASELMRRAVEKDWHLRPLSEKSVTALFYEPSSRTFGSFVSAAQKLGAGVIPVSGVQYSSVSKGETLEDTIRTFGTQSDLIVMRHPEVGAAARAAEVSYVPIVNAGDGIGEHPTQALLDYYTIARELGTVDGNHVVMVGDLKHGRTVHSLLKLLKMYDVKVSLVSPPSLRLPPELREQAGRHGIMGQETTELLDVLPDADVLYITRVQKERFTPTQAILEAMEEAERIEALRSGEAEYDKVKDAYVLTPGLMKKAKQDMIIMHPLPRVNEIDPRIDQDRRAAYFRQMENGLYMRMALLAAILGKL